MLIPIEEHELLVFWVQLFTLLLFARALGYVARKVGLPSVIGELIAGLVLGPSVFGELWPDGFHWFLPESETQSAALLGISWIGLFLLLIVTGFETDLALIRKLGRPVTLVATGSLLVPFAGGLVVGLLLPTETFLGQDVDRVTFALFVATALSVSALAVVAKILSEMGMMRRDFGQITVAVGMANDLVGWMLLGVFAGVAGSGSVSLGGLATTVGGMILFLVGMLTVGQRLVDFSLRRVRRRGENLRGALTVSILVALGAGVITQRLGVEAVLGAFVAGVVLARSRFQHHDTRHHLESITFTVFAPLFFATAGLRIDLETLRSATALRWTAVVVLVAIVAKFIGAYAGARVVGRTHRAGLALGAGLNARGALEVVIATVGLELGVFSSTAFTVIVLVPVITSIFASVSLRAVVRNYQGTPDEIERLGREAALSRNLVVRNQRMLVPSRGHPTSIAAAQLLHLAWPPESGVTVLTVGNGEGEPDIEPLRNVLHGREVEHRRIKNGSPLEAIRRETELGFGVIGLGAHDVVDGQLISPFVDDVLSEAPIPVVVVRRARNLDRPLPGAFSRALVPVAATAGSRAAQEVAFNLGRQLGTELIVAHVEAPDASEGVLPRMFHRRAVPTADATVGQRLVEQSRELAGEIGVEAEAVVRQAAHPGEELVKIARQREVDLVVVGTSLRRVAGKPFLGRNVEYILANCEATVAVVFVPIDL